VIFLQPVHNLIYRESSTIDAHTSPRKGPVILVRFCTELIFFSSGFSKIYRTVKFMNVLPEGAGLPRAERRTDRRRVDMTRLIVTIS
jgi:hypothetical protein